MIKRLLCAASIVVLSAMVFAPASEAEGLLQEEPPLFTNKDVQKYKSSHDAAPDRPKKVFPDDRGESSKDRKKRLMEDHEMEYWCKKASACRRKIEKADEEVKGIERQRDEESSKGFRVAKKNTALQKRLEKARKRLKDAEKDLDDLENEAHRKGARPGWLRCQT